MAFVNTGISLLVRRLQAYLDSLGRPVGWHGKIPDSMGRFCCRLPACPIRRLALPRGRKVAVLRRLLPGLHLLRTATSSLSRSFRASLQARTTAAISSPSAGSASSTTRPPQEVSPTPGRLLLQQHRWFKKPGPTIEPVRLSVQIFTCPTAGFFGSMSW